LNFSTYRLRWLAMSTNDRDKSPLTNSSTRLLLSVVVVNALHWAKNMDQRYAKTMVAVTLNHNRLMSSQAINCLPICWFWNRNCWVRIMTTTWSRNRMRIIMCQASSTRWVSDKSIAMSAGIDRRSLKISSNQSWTMYWTSTLRRRRKRRAMWMTSVSLWCRHSLNVSSWNSSTNRGTFKKKALHISCIAKRSSSSNNNLQCMMLHNWRWVSWIPHWTWMHYSTTTTMRMFMLNNKSRRMSRIRLPPHVQRKRL